MPHFSLSCSFILDGPVRWQYSPGSEGEPDAFTINFWLYSENTPHREELLEELSDKLRRRKIDWLKKDGSSWVFNPALLKEEFREGKTLGWLTGIRNVVPRVTTTTDRQEGREDSYSSHISFQTNPSAPKFASVDYSFPVEITDSLGRFKEDHPDPAKTAFLMMKFQGTEAHDRIVSAIKKALMVHGIEIVRADEKEYHDDLFPNVLTYCYGSGFGVAIFERIEDNEFNPNVSLEVGYLMALKKPICFLKDKTLPDLHTDLVGKLYKKFDTQDPEGTIPKEITKWLEDKNIA